MLLTNQWFKENLKREIKKYLKNGNTSYSNLWDAAKTVLRGKFIVINPCIKKQKRSQKT